MWRVIYSNDHNRVLLLCGSKEYAVNFLAVGNYETKSFIIQEIKS